MPNLTRNQYLLLISATLLFSNAITHLITRYLLSKDDSNTEIDELERKNYEQKIQSLQERITALSEEIRLKQKTSESSNTTLKEQLDRCQEVVVESKTSIAQLEEENKKLKSELDAIRMTLSVEIIKS